jgi:hypothetical protein
VHRGVFKIIFDNFKLFNFIFFGNKSLINNFVKMMEEPIFKNCFTLNYKKLEIENEYHKKRHSQLFALNRYIIISLVLLNIISTILTVEFTRNETKSFWLLIKYTAIISTSLYVTLLFMCLFSKNVKILRWCHYLAYLLILFTFSNFFNTLSHKLQMSLYLANLIYVLEILLRMCFSIFLIQCFLENIILNGLTCILIWVLYLPALDENVILTATYAQLAYTAIFLVLIGFSYVLEKQQKNAFYFQYTHAKKLEWLTNVFENMNTGFLSIRGDKITYMNSFLQNKINKLKQPLNKINYSKRTSTEGKFIITKF